MARVVVSRPRPSGEVGSVQAHTWGGVSRPMPMGVQAQGGVQAQAQGGVSQHALRWTPPSRRPLLRAVHILLECILVHTVNVEEIAPRTK